MTPTHEQMLAERLKLTFGHLVNSALPPPLAALLLAWVLADSENWQQLGIWCLATILSGLLVLYQARQGLTSGITPARAPLVLRRFIAVNVLSGCCWGVLPLLAFDPASAVDSILVMTVITGVAAGAMATLMPLFPAYLAFVLFEMGVPIVYLILLDDDNYLILGMVGILYLVSLLGMARNGARTVGNTIALRFENLDLVQQLSREKQYAQQANEAKTRFLAAASHDLRQPVHAQGLFMEALSREGLSPRQQKLLGKSRQAWQASAEMLDALLDISRIEAGVVVPECSSFHLQPLFHKLESELAPQAERQGLVLRVRETPVAVVSDPVLLERILRNLLTNAIRYTRQGGVLLGCRRRGSQVLIEVWDTGIGLSPDQQRQVFREFHQVNNPERDRRKGLGLGLAIAQGLSRILAHPLTLASRPGRGSVFRLQLPLSEAALIEQPYTEGVDVPQAPLGICVLVIDNDPAIGEAMSQLLLKWACIPWVATSASEAQRLVQTTRPDVVVSDYRLGDRETGSEVIALLRKQLGTDLPALLVTGDTSPARLREAQASGIPLLHKPLAASQLYRMLARLRPAQRLPGCSSTLWESE